jgi:hypothetical protein
MSPSKPPGHIDIGDQQRDVGVGVPCSWQFSVVPGIDRLLALAQNDVGLVVAVECLVGQRCAAARQLSNAAEARLVRRVLHRFFPLVARPRRQIFV